MLSFVYYNSVRAELADKCLILDFKINTVDSESSLDIVRFSSGPGIVDVIWFPAN